MTAPRTPHEQLQQVERLQIATTAETYWAPRWALPVMAIGIVAFFGFCAVASQGAIAWASVGWVAFVGLWLYAARRDQLARPRPERSPRAFLLLTAALWIVVIAATAIAGHPPWLVIGLAHAAWGILNGALAVRRGRYA